MKTNTQNHVLQPVVRTVGRLACYDARRLAVIVAAGEPPLRGTARYERDDLLGQVLRISLDSDPQGYMDILISEEDFDGLITEDSRYGCDFCLLLMRSR